MKTTKTSKTNTKTGIIFFAMGSRVTLPGMWIFASVTVGGGIAGPISMLLSVPITFTVYMLAREAPANAKKYWQNGNRMIVERISCFALMKKGAEKIGIKR